MGERTVALDEERLDFRAMDEYTVPDGPPGFRQAHAVDSDYEESARSCQRRTG